MAKSDVDLDTEYPPTRPSSPNFSKVLILHPIHSNFTHTHPEYNPFTLLDTILGYLAYDDQELSVKDHLYWYGISFDGVIETGGLCYEYQIFTNIFTISLFIYLQN